MQILIGYLPTFLSFSAMQRACLVLVAVAILLPLPAGTAFAACDSCAADVSSTELEEWVANPLDSTYPRLTRHVQSEMTGEKVWMISIFWEDNLLPAMMMMADQLTAVAMQQMQIVGSFLDSKHQLETQQLIQEIAARTHKDYHPSVGMCEFGSGAKSLAASERRAEVNAVVMSQRSQDRQLGAVNTAAATGEDGDKEARIRQFREKFCDRRDNNDGLNYMCDWNQDGNPGPNIGAADPVRMNKDIDYIRTVDAPWTLNMDLVGAGAGALTNEEEEIFCISQQSLRTERICPTARWAA